MGAVIAINSPLRTTLKMFSGITGCQIGACIFYSL